MRKNLKYTLPLLAILLILVGFKLRSNEQKKDQVIMQLVYDALTNVHYQPKLFNDELAAKAFDLYLENVDYSKRFLTQEDIAELEPMKLQLDDYFREGNDVFFLKSYELIQRRLKDTEGYYKEILDKPFDLTLQEEFETDPEKSAWSANDKELKDYWRKYLKYRVLTRVYDKVREAEDDSVAIPDMATLEAEAREKEMEVHDEWYKNLKDIEQVEWFATYVNAFTTYFDPHSEYYPPRQQEDFEIEMTGQLEGIGAQLRARGDYVTVEKIVVGSPSWHQGELEEGDKILKVAQGKEEAVDVVGMNINRVVKLIRGKKGTEVRLTVKKKDGNTTEIAIVRDIIELESTFARSAILDEDGKVGYIRLPKFYVDFYNEKNHDCAEDVKEELEKLKAQGVEEIVFDLRNNGGGSLQAAIDIVGLFIDKGPVVQVKGQSGPQRVYSDHKSGVAWDGPLVVMVNEFSASASEIMAAALQDYNRALIVGPRTTFGKGTVQNVIDMDQAVGLNFSDVKPLGALKLTIQKFYRINGGTTQLEGVVPNVIWPHAYNEINLGESEQKFALSVDEIKPAYYQTFPNQTKFDSAAKNSMERVSKDDHYQKIKDYAHWLKVERNETVVNLNFEAYSKSERKREEESKIYNNLTVADDSMAVCPLPTQLEMFANDSDKQEEYKRWFKGLSRDLYLQEAVRTSKDLR